MEITIIICFLINAMLMGALLVLAYSIKTKCKQIIERVHMNLSYLDFMFKLERHKLAPLRDSLEKLYATELKLGRYENCKELAESIKIIKRTQFDFNNMNNK